MIFFVSFVGLSQTNRFWTASSWIYSTEVSLDLYFQQLTLWGVFVEDSEIVEYMKTAGLLRPIHKGLVRAHFNMDDSTGSVILDQAGNDYHGNLVGGPSLVSVRNPTLLDNASERW